MSPTAIFKPFPISHYFLKSGIKCEAQTGDYTVFIDIWS